MKFNKNLKYGASALALALLLSACSGENAKNAKEDAKAVSYTHLEMVVTNEKLLKRMVSYERSFFGD